MNLIQERGGGGGGKGGWGTCPTSYQHNIPKALGRHLAWTVYPVSQKPYHQQGSDGMFHKTKLFANGTCVAQVTGVDGMRHAGSWWSSSPMGWR